MRGGPKFLGGQLLALPDYVHTATQRRGGLLKQFALARSADQARFVRAEVILCEFDQGRDQLWESIAAAGGDSELPSRVHLAAARPPGHEIDLVAHQPNRSAAVMHRFNRCI